MKAYPLWKLAVVRLSLVAIVMLYSCKAVAQVTSAGERSERERGCREFVQGFYDWYVARDKLDPKSRKSFRTSDDVLRLKPGLMNRDLLQMLKEDSEAQAKANELVGLDFDPFFNSQDPSSDFKVESAIVKEDRCRAVVIGIEQGQKRETVEPELVEVRGKWVFVNFHYRFDFGNGKPLVDDDLIRILERLREDRKKPAPINP